MKYRTLRNLGLQFFAEGGEGGGDPAAKGGDGGSEDDDEDEEGTGGSDKTFTQEDVNKLLAREKRKGKASVLKELGLNPEDKDAIANLKKILGEHQTDSEKKDNELKAAQDTASKETNRANKAEQKLKVLMAGCKKDFVDEVTAMALAKADEDTDFDAALEAVKKKMAACFDEEEEDQDKGTGRGQGHKKQKNTKPGSFGASLAEGLATNTTNPYFKN